MHLNRLSVFMLMLVVPNVSAGPPSAPAPLDPDDPRLFPKVADPNDPEKTRPTVSQEKREELGLKPKTWSGVVDPDVYTRLDVLKAATAELKEKVKKDRDKRAFKMLSGIRFEDMVYVQILLKANGNIKDVQRRALASVKASQFHAPYLFQESAGLTGFINKEGLEQLAKNPDVVGVCLDDKPVPQKAKTIYKDDLPEAKMDEAANEPGVAEGKVDPDVYRAFLLNDRVDVRISLRMDSLPEPDVLPADLLARNELRNQMETAVRNRVLSSVAADDFWLWVRLGSGMSGFITREGVEQLWKHPDVQRIGLKQMMRIPEHKNGNHFSP